jgi:glycosyltransferase involved in cell wall biosynthesis
LFTTGDSTCPVERRFLLPEAEGNRIGANVPELRHVMAAYDDDLVRAADIVHDHTVFGPVYGQQFDDVRLVTTIHGPFVEELVDIYGRIAKRVPVIAVSHAQRKPAPQVPIARVIHHGVDVNEFPVGTGSGGYALFLGRMAADKGAHTAITVARKAQVPLLMAGKMREPAEFEYFETQVEPLLGDDARYLGEVPHDHKVQLLADARAVLFPIRWNEPFGLVMIEALACGTPVLAFPEGAAPEVIEDGRTGFLCHDEAAMAEALGRIDTIDRKACRAAVEGYFSTERMVREHLDLFESIIR